MATLPKKLCPLCSFSCPSVSLLLSHLRLVHSNDPRFLVTCGIDGCTVTFKHFHSLYSHVYRSHPTICTKRKVADFSSQYEQLDTVINVQQELTVERNAMEIENGQSSALGKQCRDFQYIVCALLFLCCWSTLIFRLFILFRSFC